MLRWLTERVATRYGAVEVLTWAVPDPNVAPAAASAAPTAAETKADAAIEELIRTHRKALEPAADEIGAVLWNSNAAALNYLAANVFNSPPPLPAPQVAASTDRLTGWHILELGAGVGVLGMALAMAGATAAITDISELVPVMKINLKLNEKRIAAANGVTADAASGKSKSVKSRGKPKPTPKPKPKSKSAAAAAATAIGSCVEFELRWGDPLSPALKSYFGGRIDLVLLCDSLYGNPLAWPDLVRTLNELSDFHPTGAVPVINFCEQRITAQVEPAFIQLLTTTDARWECVGPTPIDDKSLLAMPVRVTRMIRRIAAAVDDSARCDQLEIWTRSGLLELYRTIIRSYLVPLPASKQPDITS